MTISVLQPFPKQRPELPEAYRAIYTEHYLRNRRGFSRHMESWMHRRVAHNGGALKTLEIGAGNLNHLRFEPTTATYDVVESLTVLVESSPYRARVRRIFGSVEEIQHETYDRIISIATFEHLCNLPSVVERCGSLLRNDGRLQIAIPSEGTLLWKLGWMLTTGIDFRIRYGLNYGVLMRHEHVNSADEIAAVLKTYFREVRCSVFGLTPSLSLYRYYECRQFSTE